MLSSVVHIRFLFFFWELKQSRKFNSSSYQILEVLYNGYHQERLLLLIDAFIRRGVMGRCFSVPGRCEALQDTAAAPLPTQGLLQAHTVLQRLIPHVKAAWSLNPIQKWKKSWMCSLDELSCVTVESYTQLAYARWNIVLDPQCLRAMINIACSRTVPMQHSLEQSSLAIAR